MQRRQFITLLGGAAAAWPLGTRAQQAGMPVVGFINAGTADGGVRNAAAFRKGLSEAGYTEGQNVIVEYHWLGGNYDRLSALMTDLVQRHVTVITTPGITSAALAAKAATATIPIVFGIGQDPVKLGLVASLARPGGNATGINFFTQDLTAKRLGLLHELVPKAARIAALVNPASVVPAEAILRDVQEAARIIGLQVVALNASTIKEIDAAFGAIARERAEALFVAGDGFFFSRRVQLAMLAVHHAVPAIYSLREYPEAGGFMSYGTSFPDVYRQIGVYAGRIIKGEKPADLPVQQSTKFEFVINAQAASLLNLTVPPTLIARADEVVE
jgi:putative ABC transport system substrate-binding protein